MPSMTQGPGEDTDSASGAAAMRASIRARLRADVPAIANLYEIGLDMVENSPTETHKYFIGHAMREIRTRLPLHYGVVAVDGHFDYAAGVDAFASDWISEVQPIIREETPSPSNADVVVRRAIATDIDTLVDGHRRVGDKPRDLYTRLSERINPTSAPATLTHGIIEQWLKIGLPGMAHMPGPNSAGFSLSATLSAWDTMEQYLHYLFAPAHITYPELDSIIEDANAD